MIRLQRQVGIPIVVSCALMMQQLDSSAIATALPAMSQSLSVPVVDLHTAITAYLFSSAMFLPVSGWAADRFGQKLVFCLAIAVFTAGSISCALATNLQILLLARILQGLGGAMMVPVARLILVREVEKTDLVAAMALMSMTAVIGPAAGPLLGGLITTVASWRLIFWINVPIGVIGIICTMLFIREVRSHARRSFDGIGFVLTAIGFGGIMVLLEAVSSSGRLDIRDMVPFVFGVGALAAYYWHYRLRQRAILDLALFRYATFRASLLGGSIFRIGLGSLPFLLPLLMQTVFNYSPLQSGFFTFMSAIGSFGIRANMKRILGRFGFRTVLIVNSLTANLSVWVCSLFSYGTPKFWIMGILLFGGVFRALQMVSVNTMAFAELIPEEMSDATTLSQIAQRISQSMGVSMAAFLLAVYGRQGGHASLHAFSMSFRLISLVSAISVLFFFMLPANAGEAIVHRKR